MAKLLSLLQGCNLKDDPQTPESRMTSLELCFGLKLRPLVLLLNFYFVIPVIIRYSRDLTKRMFIKRIYIAGFLGGLGSDVDPITGI